ncbi:restriction system protein [Pseudomonas citronellolis]|uniref:restriction endonuclease n=1 Tax=Pseudomonas citronellolis TaxID=53408 RepID=UPI0020A0085D|nr:restriction endonuclease [Pseudomonas citronellolis]MCP1642994.1 restriction system protein [Pseudomonas citronellolis]MCP1665874.1 restriction system protein [Pseudomonas citronellolis]MCP1696783.1 restriction system protein [Pseudomonas citronellolis]MCP1703475.1 restriction system protein [Pseudomonas citronellolis]MCP1797609.1 restriction system protein [Pseudomonas citronellolis]
MARRKTSPFEDLIELASDLPWWAGLLAAAVSWFVLHAIAGSYPEPFKDPQQMGGFMLGSALRILALAGQFVLPIVFVSGAFLSFVRRTRREKLHRHAREASDPGKTLDGISWREFEQLVGETFRRKGFTVIEKGGNGPDGGVDLVLHLGTDKYLVQCKQWKAINVGVTVIREFFGVMAAEGAAGGFIVTSGRYTAEAKAFAEGRNIQLVDGVLLKRWISNRSTATPAAPERSNTDKATDLPSVPLCPVCNEHMIIRTAKRGSNIGSEFWGCTKFPVCRGVRRLT